MIKALLFFGLLTTASTNVVGQTFPIIPLSTPVYPADDINLRDLVWDNRTGSLSRLGDLNGDGIKDLLVYFPLSDYNEINQNKCLWLFAGTTSSFSAPTVLSTDTIAYSGEIHDIRILDFNRDEVNDIVFLLDAGQVVMPWINTTQGFSETLPLTSDLNGFDGRAGRFKSTDINDDGNNDILVWNDDLQVIAWLSDDHGQYTRADLNLEDMGFGLDYNSFEAAYTDFDGDGDKDILLHDHTYIYLVERTGPNDYSPIQYAQISVSNYDTNNENLIFADINGDGLLDIFTHGYESSIYNRDVFAAILAPFSLTEAETAEFIPFPEFNRDSHLDELLDSARFAFTPGDLDGDGADEIILGTSTNGGTGLILFDPLNINGRRGLATHYSIHGDGRFVDLANSYYPEDHLYQESQYLDTNGDGVKDRLIVASARRPHSLQDNEQENSGVMIWGAISNPYEPEAVLNEQTTILATTNMTHLEPVDFDHNGVSELVISLSEGIRVVGESSQQGYHFIPETSFDDIGGFRSKSANFDADTTPDLVSMEIHDVGVPRLPAVYMNIEAGEVGDPRLNLSLGEQYFIDRTFPPVVNTGMDGESSGFAVGDANGDGFDDLIIRGYYDTQDFYLNDAAIVWFSDGVGGFNLGPATQLTPTTGLYTQLIESINLNNDPFCDIVSIGFAESGFIVEAYTNLGNGEFILSWSSPLSDGITTESPFWLYVDDFDADGYNDLAVLRSTRHIRSHIHIFFGSSEGLSTNAVILQGRGDIEITGADLDGNGLQDIISCFSLEFQQLPNSVTVQYQISKGVFLPRFSINDLLMSSVATIDLNNDRGIDIVTSQATSLSLSRHKNIRVFSSVPAPCLPDLNLDKQLNFYDISLFIELFLAQRPLVDFNRDGSHNFFDVSAMIESYLQGCP